MMWKNLDWGFIFPSAALFHRFDKIHHKSRSIVRSILKKRRCGSVRTVWSGGLESVSKQHKRSGEEENNQRESLQSQSICFFSSFYFPSQFCLCFYLVILLPASTTTTRCCRCRPCHCRYCISCEIAKISSTTLAFVRHLRMCPGPAHLYLLYDLNVNVSVVKTWSLWWCGIVHDGIYKAVNIA